MKQVLVAVVFIIIVVSVIILFRGNEDSWIKDERGIWVEHGKPKEKPSEVSIQEELIQKAKALLSEEKETGTDLSNGPCLGRVADDWVVDIAHNPREAIDDKLENQCVDFNNGDVHHFIEIDQNGEVIEIY
jgi:hypothetical protein